MGKDITLGARDAHTGRFNFVRDPVTRDVSFDDTEAHAVMVSACDDLGGDWYDPNGGSKLGSLKSLTSATVRQAEGTVLVSEQDLVSSGRISNLEVAGSTGRANGLAFLQVDIRWKNAAGEQQAKTATG